MLFTSQTTSVANLSVFPRIRTCFLWSCGFFEDLQVACFWACFNWNFLVFWACFLQISALRIVFFFKFLWHFYCCNLLRKAYWACFCENMFILGLFFRICNHDFLFDFLADFSFGWIFLPTHFGLVFRLNYRFLACFSNLLACFCKMTCITGAQFWKKTTAVATNLSFACFQCIFLCLQKIAVRSLNKIGLLFLEGVPVLG